jgi:hypothetical protein
MNASVYDSIMESLKAGDDERAERLCREMLEKPTLPIYVRCGCHEALSTGIGDDFLWHAKQAVVTYEHD